MITRILIVLCLFGLVARAQVPQVRSMGTVSGVVAQNPLPLGAGNRSAVIVHGTNLFDVPILMLWTPDTSLATNETAIFDSPFPSGGQWTAIPLGGVGSISFNGTVVSNPQFTNTTEIEVLVVDPLVGFVLAQSGVGAGSYTNPVMTVTSKGVISAIANGPSGGLSLDDVNNALIMVGGISKAYNPGVSITLLTPLISVNGGDSFFGSQELNFPDTATATWSRSGSNLNLTVSAAAGTNASRIFVEGAPVDSPNFVADGGDNALTVAGTNITSIIKTNAVTTPKIGAGQVTASKLADDLSLAGHNSFTPPLSETPDMTETGGIASTENALAGSVAALTHNDGGSTNYVVSIPYQLFAGASSNWVPKINISTGRWFLAPDENSGGSSLTINGGSALAITNSASTAWTSLGSGLFSVSATGTNTASIKVETVTVADPNLTESLGDSQPIASGSNIRLMHKANSVKGTNILDGTILSADLGNGSVIQSKVAANAIMATNIVDGQVGTVELASAAVTRPKLATDSVASTNIVDGAVATVDLANAAVTQAKLAANSVMGTNIVTGEVGALQIASTGVTPGSYTSADITVDADGRITAASNGTGGTNGSGITIDNILTVWGQAYWETTLDNVENDWYAGHVTGSGSHVGNGSTAMELTIDFDESMEPTNYVVHIEIGEAPGGGIANAAIAQHIVKSTNSVTIYAQYDGSVAQPNGYSFLVSILSTSGEGLVGTVDQLNVESTYTGSLTYSNYTGLVWFQNGVGSIISQASAVAGWVLKSTGTNSLPAWAAP